MLFASVDEDDSTFLFFTLETSISVFDFVTGARRATVARSGVDLCDGGSVCDSAGCSADVSKAGFWTFVVAGDDSALLIAPRALLLLAFPYVIIFFFGGRPNSALEAMMDVGLGLAHVRRKDVKTEEVQATSGKTSRLSPVT